MTTDQATGAGLVAAILDPANHADDDLRLVYADWLEEQGEGARGEFIRVQVELAGLVASVPARYDSQAEVEHVRRGLAFAALHRRERELLEAHGYGWCDGLLGEDWKVDGGTKDAGGVAIRYFKGLQQIDVQLTFRRGFVAEITLTLADWYGSPCGRCETNLEQRPYVTCPDCRGSGHTPGHGPALVRACPLSRVMLRDRAPHPTLVGEHGWDNEDGGPATTPSVLPGVLWDLLRPTGRRRNYPTCAAALDALSAACLSWAGDQAEEEKE